MKFYLGTHKAGWLGSTGLGVCSRSVPWTP